MPAEVIEDLVSRSILPDSGEQDRITQLRDFIVRAYRRALDPAPDATGVDIYERSDVDSISPQQFGPRLADWSGAQHHTAAVQRIGLAEIVQLALAEGIRGVLRGHA